MKPFFSILLVSLFCSQNVNAQHTQEMAGGKGVLYMGFGTNLSFYSKTDLHFHSSDFDFTLFKVRGKDDGGLKFDGGGAAQYSYQVGYYFKKKNFGIEFNFDHIKYFARTDQIVHTVGTVNGQKMDEDLPITTYVQNFEHSNGGNYILLNFVKWKDLVASKD